jgi:hypothetical protein
MERRAFESLDLFRAALVLPAMAEIEVDCSGLWETREVGLTQFKPSLASTVCTAVPKVHRSQLNCFVATAKSDELPDRRDA